MTGYELVVPSRVRRLGRRGDLPISKMCSTSKGGRAASASPPGQRFTGHAGMISGRANLGSRRLSRPWLSDISLCSQLVGKWADGTVAEALGWIAKRHEVLRGPWKAGFGKAAGCFVLARNAEIHDADDVQAGTLRLLDAVDATISTVVLGSFSVRTHSAARIVGTQIEANIAGLIIALCELPGVAGLAYVIRIRGPRSVGEREDGTAGHAADGAPVRQGGVSFGLASTQGGGPSPPGPLSRGMARCRRRSWRRKPPHWPSASLGSSRCPSLPL